MALILNIETATDVCSVALALDGKIISSREMPEGQGHARYLTTFIQECITEADLKLSDLDAIAVSKGPGSFTGLRIGVASAKGLCFALNKPLLSVNTLQSMAQVCYSKISSMEFDLLCPMIDARRMEVYTALFDRNLSFVQDTKAEILDQQTFVSLLKAKKLVFFGDGMDKFRTVCRSFDNAVFISDFLPSASGMVHFSENSYKRLEFEDPAYFEPFYLKDFYSPVSKSV